LGGTDGERLYTDNDPQNPFGCVLLSDLFLPQKWSDDPDRCREAGCSEPTDRTYGLIVARNKATKEIKYFVSNAPAHVLSTAKSGLV
jgi:hypothetical protein